MTRLQSCLGDGLHLPVQTGVPVPAYQRTSVRAKRARQGLRSRWVRDLLPPTPCPCRTCRMCSGIPQARDRGKGSSKGGRSIAADVLDVRRPKIIPPSQHFPLRLFDHGHRLHTPQPQPRHTSGLLPPWPPRCPAFLLFSHLGQSLDPARPGWLKPPPNCNSESPTDFDHTLFLFLPHTRPS